MTSANGSLLGFAKQVAKGTPNVTDNSFKYVLFTQGGVSPNSMVVPLDPEVGGGAMLNDMKKVGVMSGGALEMIPRPDTLGMFLLGALGKDTPAAQGAAYNHVFTLPTDQFDAPYYTVRSSPGGMWGEQLQDVRVSALGLSWKGASFLRASVALQGGMPGKVSTTLWDASTKVDNGPQFLSPVSAIEVPTGTPVKVLSGSFMAGMSMPLDQQWIVGSMSPDAQDIVSRSFAIQLVVKVTDGTLYSKMAYDPAGGNAWVAALMREANIKINLTSDVIADTIYPYNLSIAANGKSDSTANVVWNVSPISVRAGQQVVMAVTGIFMASAAANGEPITCTLTNKTATY